jgi:hypothetical protein
VLFENENTLAAELRDRSRRREAAHTRPDHDDIRFLVHHHVSSVASPT